MYMCVYVRAWACVRVRVCVQLAPYTVGSSLVLSCSLFNMNNLDADYVVKLSTFLDETDCVRFCRVSQSLPGTTEAILQARWRSRCRWWGMPPTWPQRFPAASVRFTAATHFLIAAQFPCKRLCYATKPARLQVETLVGSRTERHLVVARDIEFRDRGGVHGDPAVLRRHKRSPRPTAFLERAHPLNRLERTCLQGVVPRVTM